MHPVVCQAPVGVPPLLRHATIGRPDLQDFSRPAPALEDILRGHSRLDAVLRPVRPHGHRLVCAASDETDQRGRQQEVPPRPARIKSDSCSSDPHSAPPSGESLALTRGAIGRPRAADPGLADIRRASDAASDWKRSPSISAHCWRPTARATGRWLARAREHRRNPGDDKIWRHVGIPTRVQWSQWTPPVPAPQGRCQTGLQRVLSWTFVARTAFSSFRKGAGSSGFSTSRWFRPSSSNWPEIVVGTTGP